LGKKWNDKKLVSSLSFVAVFGSGIRDPGWVKIRIREKHPGSATLPLGNRYDPGYKLQSPDPGSRTQIFSPTWIPDTRDGSATLPATLISGSRTV
jgi:hypothetical protein